MIGKKDLLIMSVLRKNSRITLTRMGRKLNMPISTIYDKLKLHEGRTIKKHTCLIDFGKLGFNARAKAIIKVERDERSDVLDFLLKIPNVNSVYKISNGYDYMLELIFRDVKEMEDFFEMLESKFNIRDKQVYFVIEDLKREAFLSEPEMLGLILRGD
jgi:DNA-binding Lrp family transcriptional regulator